MSKSNNLSDFVKSIADAIRLRDNTTASIYPKNFEGLIKPEVIANGSIGSKYQPGALLLDSTLAIPVGLTLMKVPLLVNSGTTDYSGWYDVWIIRSDYVEVVVGNGPKGKVDIQANFNLTPGVGGVIYFHSNTLSSVDVKTKYYPQESTATVEGYAVGCSSNLLHYNFNSN